MDEEEWLASVEPRQMLMFLGDRVSDRKARLFRCACCRRFWGVLQDPLARRAVEVAEQFSDGLADERQLAKAQHGAETARGFTYYDSVEERATDLVISSVARPRPPYPGHEMWPSIHIVDRIAIIDGGPDTRFDAAETLEPRYAAGRLSEQTAQAALLREMFGNPFQPTMVDPEWLTSTVTAIARGMCASGDFSAMPILADALQDAGCENSDILDHCRGPGPHARGCWVVDLVLEKE